MVKFTIWFYLPITIAANIVATPTAVVAGTYHAAFSDATNNCYSSATTAVTATVIGCCNAGSAAPSLIKN